MASKGIGSDIRKWNEVEGYHIDYTSTCLASYEASNDCITKDASLRSAAILDNDNIISLRTSRGPIHKSCSNCQNSRLRCDLSLPCHHCSRRNLSCEYKPKLPSKTSLMKEERAQRRRIRENTKTSVMKKKDTQGSISSALVRRPIAPPPVRFNSQSWYDHLLSFFGSKRSQSHRWVLHMLRRVPRAIYEEHWFDLTHMRSELTVIKDLGVKGGSNSNSSRAISRVHPSLVFAHVAIALRTMHRGPWTTLLPREAVPPPITENDLSMRIQRAAETYFAQSILDEDAESAQSMGIAQAAAAIMKLQPELSESYMFYLKIATKLTRQRRLHTLIAGGSNSESGLTFDGPLFEKVSSIDVLRGDPKVEEAARLRLFVPWVGFRIGYAYPNIEMPGADFVAQETRGAQVFSRFSDEDDEQRRGWIEEELSGDIPGSAYDAGAADHTGVMRSLEFRAKGLSMLTKCMSAWHIYDANYLVPSKDFAGVLRLIDDGEFLIEALRIDVDMTRPSALRQCFAKFIVAVAHLHGIVLRRVGFIHNANLRHDLCTVLKSNERVGLERFHRMDGHKVLEPNRIEGAVHRKDDVQTLSHSTKAWEKEFVSAGFEAYINLMERFGEELDVDYISARVSGAHPATELFSLDSAFLHAAATKQYAEALSNTYRILGHPEPDNQAFVKKLFDTAQMLLHHIERHRLLRQQMQSTQSSNILGSVENTSSVLQVANKWVKK